MFTHTLAVLQEVISVTLKNVFCDCVAQKLTTGKYAKKIIRNKRRDANVV